MSITQEIYVKGVVQGVGFRPFVYQIAKKYGLVGNVRNLGDLGVKILISGEISACKAFIHSLKKDKPKIASFTSIKIQTVKSSEKLSDFTILPSTKGNQADSLSIIPPDIGICDLCLEEIFSSNNRRHNYSLNSCTYCGPRFSMIFNAPYDRENTAMREFPLCPQCMKEYLNPEDRRFHAQGVSCSCGPNISLHDKESNLITRSECINMASKLLAEGNILAIKGVGGFHIACSAINDDVITILRKRKRKRYTKPFAVMSKDLHVIRSFADVSTEEESLLRSYNRPIVLLKQKGDILSRFVAPGLDSVGVFLPYTGIHALLLHHFPEPALIMTSGNASSLPISISNKNAFSELKDIADFFLIHNRQIVQRCDDSVIRVVNGAPKLVRRSRGYVPKQIEFPFTSGKSVIAVGADLKNVFGLFKGNRCTLSQYIGDMSNIQVIDFHLSSLHHLLNLMQFKSVDSISCDLHPEFQSTRIASDLAGEYNVDIFPVQHHWAHAASLLIDNQIPPGEEIIAIVADGVGYGNDGLPWGGEILRISYSSFERLAHLEPQALPGGDRCAIYPARFLAGILAKFLPHDLLRNYFINHHQNSFEYGITEIELVLQQITKRINSPQTTSLGRILDSISSMLEICSFRSYEGEPAMKLEAQANQQVQTSLNLSLPIIEKIRNRYEIKTTPLYEYLFSLLGKYSSQELAFFTQKTLAEALAKSAIILARAHDISKIGFSGGVAYNYQITKTLSMALKKAGFQFLQHNRVPPGDGGIAVGQLAITSQSL